MPKKQVNLIIDNLILTYQNSKNLGETKVLKNVSFSVAKGEFVAIVGPSGCGKTSLLYCLAGLQKPTGGKIIIDGEEIKGCGKDRSLVFQDPLLLPWRNVLSNIGYGLEMQKLSKNEILKQSKYYLKLVRLAGFENHYPHQLSGGQRQRVNLARAICSDPEILLLDEPFSHLDALTRELMQQELLALYEKTKKTFIFVTHDIEEAIFLASRVVVLSKSPGTIKAIIPINFGRPRELSFKGSTVFSKLRKKIRRLIYEEI